MNIVLTALEARIIGCLLEKQITTPDQYPLSINALTNACNQKSNRDPVLNLAEAEVQQLVDGLVRKHVMIERSGFGSRVAKYQHCFCNTEFSGLKFSLQELAIVCELLVRGPQTPGELRTRASRMSEVDDVSLVDAALQSLMSRPDGPFVARLAREPGRRDSRYAHLFCGEVADSTTEAEVPLRGGGDRNSGEVDDRLTRLEKLVDQLFSEVSDLRKRLGDG